MSARLAHAFIVAAELHVLVIVSLPSPHRARVEATASIEVPAPDLEPASEPRLAATSCTPSPGPVAPTPKSRRSPPPPAARAAAVVVTPDATDTAVSDSAPTHAGGVTQAGASSPVPVYGPAARAWGIPGGTGNGSGGLPAWANLSRPARLGGDKRWPCRVPGADPLAPTSVRVRALVRPDGRAIRVELLDVGDDRIYPAALPCAMREAYVPGLDRAGRPAEAWTLPFRVVVSQ